MSTEKLLPAHDVEEKASQLAKLEKMLMAMSSGDWEYTANEELAGLRELTSITSLLQNFCISIQERLLEEKKLADTLDLINSGKTLSEVFNYAYDLFRSIIPYDQIGVSVIDFNKDTVSALWRRSESPTIKIGAGYSASLKGSSLEELLNSDKPRIINDLEQYLKEHPNSVSTKDVVEEGMRSSLTFPLIVMGKPFGFIFFSSFRKDIYKNVHLSFFKQIANRFAIIVEKTKLYDELVTLNNTKTKFLGMAAHDLRSPLIVLNGYLEILLAQDLGTITEEQKAAIQTMWRTCDRMSKIINDIVDISAIESGNLSLNVKPINLKETLESNSTYNKALAHTKHIELVFNIPENLPFVIADASRISQVMDNLISNAVKFSYSGSKIVVSAIAVENVVEVSVSDSGQGIPEEELPKLFSDFGKTTVRPTAGEPSTGLGLAIVKRIITAHNGTVSVQSKLGEGSRFSFTLQKQ